MILSNPILVPNTDPGVDWVGKVSLYYRVELSSAIRYLVHILYVAHAHSIYHLLVSNSTLHFKLVPTHQPNEKWVGHHIDTCSCILCVLVHTAWQYCDRYLGHKLLLWNYQVSALDNPRPHTQRP